MVVSLYAAILGLIYIGLSFYVIKGRFQYKTSLGDGGHAALMKRIRIHGNFMEYVPIALILLLLVEHEGVSEVFLHVLGGFLVLGRMMHIVGVIQKEGTSVGRAGGMILTVSVIIISSLVCLKAYFFL